jgi:sugar phosphate isomerase/epimerase
MIQCSLASFPGRLHAEALKMAVEGVAEPLFGAVAIDHVQLVPQSIGALSEEICIELRRLAPSTRFRLHANVHIPGHRRKITDLSTFQFDQDWFEAAAGISKSIGASAYSAHAGYRRNCDMEAMLDNARRVADLFECPVAVEGLYPEKTGQYLVSTWDEYRRLFESGVPYALDLSHLNIVAVQSGVMDLGLVSDMLACERCIEVHVSDNDGTGDHHQLCSEPTWWEPLLAGLNPSAVVFSEGNQLRRRQAIGGAVR